MIELDRKLNPEVIGCIITGISELNKEKSSSDNDLMLDLQERAREDSSSNGDTVSYGDNRIYKDEEH